MFFLEISPVEAVLSLKMYFCLFVCLKYLDG